jgi:hypothetical protein
MFVNTKSGIIFTQKASLSFARIFNVCYTSSSSFIKSVGRDLAL